MPRIRGHRPDKTHDEVVKALRSVGATVVPLVSTGGSPERRELHDAEHADCDWFCHVGSTISSFCRRACEARGLDWKWVLQAIERERLDERTEPR